ncbi:hypothetical protein T4D_7248 [Trichinella pseudospiralis]|uniref:Uncharacterized protein n=1 Tax=Trichinella pseudospiralis TaxID=6337 RepID=A0A0V1DLM5_TRIPS|nr:hypothetical protein T4D_7248 [Trichinella pseudospiralis]
MRQIIVSCCGQSEAAPYPTPGIKMKTYSCDISTGLLPMTCSSCLGQCCPQ